MKSQWTAREVVDAVAMLPPVPNDGELWKKVWTRPVQEFGLSFYMPTPELPYSKWDERMWSAQSTLAISTNRILFSAQTIIRLDVLEWYLQMPVWKENFDTDGWFGNDHPVLIELPDRTYVIKDGNHRIISRMLSNFDFVDAYVMKGK